MTVVWLLLKKGVDVKKEQRVTKSAHLRRRARSANITTASTTLHLDTKNGHETVAKLLLIHGASPNAKEADEEYHKINSYGGVFVKRQMTALRLAVNNGYEAMIQLLVEKGARSMQFYKKRKKSVLYTNPEEAW